MKSSVFSTGTLIGEKVQKSNQLNLNQIVDGFFFFFLETEG